MSQYRYDEWIEDINMGDKKFLSDFLQYIRVSAGREISK